MTATSARRVTDQSDPNVNERIRQQTDASLAYFAAHPEEIDRRLRELDEEWGGGSFATHRPVSSSS